jgi:hypothetical protein
MVNLHLVEMDDIGYGVEELTSDTKFETADDAINYARGLTSYYGIGRITQDEYGGDILAWVEWSYNATQPMFFEVKWIKRQ